MAMDEFQAVKNELEQLNVELKRFKEELRTTRIEELKQVVHAPARRSHPRMPEISMSVGQEAPVSFGSPCRLGLLFPENT
jgi:hypothetical protein